MRSRRLYSGLTKIFLKEAEDKNWQVYLATISNPMAQVGSFEDFIKKSGSNTQVVEMTQDQID